MTIIDLASFGTVLSDPKRAKNKDFPEIDIQIQQSSSNIIVFDVSKLEYLGYSYSKQTMRRALRKLIANKYGRKFFLLKAPADKILLEGLVSALREESLFMIQFESESSYPHSFNVIGGSKSTSKGELSDRSVRTTLGHIMRSGEIYTNELAKKMKITPQNCNNRLKLLQHLHFIEREKTVSPTGGIIFKNKRINL
jgi:hypothetical protein